MNKNNKIIMLALLFLNENNLQANISKEQIQDQGQIGASIQYKLIGSIYSGAIIDCPATFRVGGVISYLFNNKVVNDINISMLYDVIMSRHKLECLGTTLPSENYWNIQISLSIFYYLYCGLKFKIVGSTHSATMFIIGFNFSKTVKNKKFLIRGFGSANFNISKFSISSNKEKVSSDTPTPVVPAKKIAEAKADEETKRLADEEAKRLADEETKRLADEETKRLADKKTKRFTNKERFEQKRSLQREFCN